MSILFESVSIKKMTLKNRFVRSATYDGFADNGHVSDQQIKFFSELAEGGVGLIIAGIAYVHPAGQVSPLQNSIAGDEFVDGYKKLTQAVHDRDTKIALQLFHAGRDAALLENLLPLKYTPLAPSFIGDDPHYKGKYRAMMESEIWEIIQAFGDAAVRAREAGFDAVQVHGAHAYLLMQFLSPITNHRDDQWGGSLENRLRFHREIYTDIRKKVGEDYPILIKLGVQDGFSGGFEFTEGKQVAKVLADIGFDALEISQGLRGKSYEETEFRPRINSLKQEAYFGNWTREIKGETNVPIMMVGGLKTLSLMEEKIHNKEADFISLCRPLLAEPGLINDFKINKKAKARCISCNQCVDQIVKGKQVCCVQNARS
ncbi:NADH oxidase [Sporomusa rhizae]|uniref:oxidoreductase n=1 Tax=Sporomusa rhizae TaxID=357999 RepID=UPI00352B49EE